MIEIKLQLTPARSIPVGSIEIDYRLEILQVMLFDIELVLVDPYMEQLVKNQNPQLLV